MTRTINRETYGLLLAQYQPKVIETEAENEQALVLAQELEHRPERTSEEDALLELLVTLIEKFEEEHYPLSESSPQEMVLHLMEAQGIKPEDLAGMMGSLGVVEDVLSGKSRIDKAQALVLAEFFHVSPQLLT